MDDAELLSYLAAMEKRILAALPPIPKASRLLSTDEAAQYLAISSETLRRMCRRKAITFIAVTPHEYRFAPVDLDEYVASRRNLRKSAVR